MENNKSATSPQQALQAEGSGAFGVGAAPAGKAGSKAVLQWFAAKTRPHQELKIKEKLDELGFETFLPLKEQLRILRTKKRKVMRPLVPRLLFVRCRREELFNLLNEHFLPLSFIYNLETKRPLVVPDRQMRDFMFFVDFARDSIRVLNDKLKAGDRVRVVKGDLAGLEGELIRIKGHKRVVVRLQGLFSVAAGTYLPKHYLERIAPANTDS